MMIDISFKSKSFIGKKSDVNTLPVISKLEKDGHVDEWISLKMTRKTCSNILACHRIYVINFHHKRCLGLNKKTTGNQGREREKEEIELERRSLFLFEENR